MSFPDVSAVKNPGWSSAGDAGDMGSGQEDPLEEGITTQSGILARKILCTEEPGGLQSVELQRVGHD